MPLVAGVDSSTSATKVEVRDADSGKVVGRGSSPHPPTQPPRSEQDPAAWWTAFESAWEQAGSPTVAAISVGGQQHGMVVLDDGREVVRPAKLWNDTESAADATSLVEQLPGGRKAWAEACGSVPVASFTITKLAWLRRSEPDAFARLAHVVLPHDWLTFCLTGSLTTDRGDASGTGYWSAASGTYRDDLLALVDADRDWSAALPTVLGPRRRRGGVARGDGRSGHRRQHGRRPRSRTAIGGRGGVDRDVRHGVLGVRLAERRYFGHRRRVRRRHGSAPAAGLHAQRHEGDRRCRPAARGGPRGVRRVGLRRDAGCRRSDAAPVPRRRTHTRSTVGDRCDQWTAQQRQPRAAGACCRRRCGVRPARRARCVVGVRSR